MKRTIMLDITEAQLAAITNAVAHLDCELEQNGDAFGETATVERRTLQRAHGALLHAWDRGIKR